MNENTKDTAYKQNKPPEQEPAKQKKKLQLLTVKRLVKLYINEFLCVCGQETISLEL